MLRCCIHGTNVRHSYPQYCPVPKQNLLFEISLEPHNSLLMPLISMTYLSLREVDDSESGQVTEAVGRVVCETLAATHIDFLQRRAVTCQ